MVKYINTLFFTFLSLFSVSVFAENEATTAANSVVAVLKGDGFTAIVAVGAALLTLAGIAVVFKWVKAAIFS